jgi:hypothetical protein
MICVERNYLIYSHRKAGSHNNRFPDILIDCCQNINTEKSVIKKISEAYELTNIRSNGHLILKDQFIQEGNLYILYWGTSVCVIMLNNYIFIPIYTTYLMC